MVINKTIANPLFVLYYLLTYKPQLVKESFGGTQPNVNQFKVATIRIAIPPLEEQGRIVSYLNDKTGKIDARVSLLSKKRDAYQRLKKALISRVVTKGLNPNAKFKPSGVDWIGEIPEGWEVKRFKDIFIPYSTGLTPDSKNDNYFCTEDGFTWVTIADISPKHITKSKLSITNKAIASLYPPKTMKGSLMFSFKLSIGKVAFAGKDLFTNEAIVSIPPSCKYRLGFFYYLFPSVLQMNATENIYGAKMLNQKIIANMLVLNPPVSEQQSIASYLDEKCSEIDANIAKLEKQIEKYKELKRALISEVVTGKRRV